MQRRGNAKLLRWMLLVSLGAALLSIGSAALPERRKLEAPQVKEPDLSQKIKAVPTTEDAILKARAFQQRLPVHIRPFVRFIYNRTGKRENVQAASHILNFFSRAGQPRRIRMVDGDPRVLWFDANDYATTAEDVSNFLNTWAKLAFDPTFSELVTKDEVKIRFNQGIQLPCIHADVAVTRAKAIKGGIQHETRDVDLPVGRFRYPDHSGRSCDIKVAQRYRLELEFTTTDRVEISRELKSINLLDFDDFDVVRFNPDNNPLHRQLQEDALDDAAIVSLEYLAYRGLRTIKDDGVYAAVYGGLWYEFSGVQLAKNVKGAEKATDFDVFLQDQGVFRIKSDEGFDELLDRLRSDQRGVIWRSDITRKIRRWDLIEGQAGYVGSNAVISITHDVDDRDKDIATNAFFNLVKFQDAALEVIYPKRNGYHGFTLFNGKGVRQDRVPPGVTVDHTIPMPGTMELQPARGCISCHGSDGSEGYKSLKNDVKGVLGYYRNRGIRQEPPTVGLRTDILFDFDLVNKRLTDSFDFINSKYTGEPTKFLTRGRDDYSEAFRLGADWSEEDVKGEGKLNYVRLGSQRIIDLELDYWYSPVDARRSLAELGVDCPADRAKNVFKHLCMDNTGGYEIPTLAALSEGQTVNRSDWDLVRSHAYKMAVPRMPILLKEESNEKQQR